MKELALLVVFAALAAPATHAPAELLVKGQGVDRVLVREQFGSAQRARYDLFAVRCTKCHAMGRIIDALTWGVAPISGATFDDPAIRRYVIKMMRKRKSGIAKREARDLIEFLLVARRLTDDGEPSAAGHEGSDAGAPAAPPRDGGPP